MKILNVSSPQWADVTHTVINAQVEFEGLGVVPFSASASDVEEYGKALFAALVAGSHGPITQEPPVDTAAINALAARKAASNRIKAIKDELIEHLLTLQVGTPAEKALATAAANQLRAELALEKAKL